MSYWNRMNKVLVVLVFLSTLACTQRQIKMALPEVSKVTTEPEEAINDAEWLKTFEDKATEYIAQYEIIGSEVFKDQMTQTSCSVELSTPSTTALTGYPFYKTLKKSVLLMGKVNKCDQCPDNHIASASAFVLTQDGICATNYHVFKSYNPAEPNEYITIFVMDSEQNVYPVTEVLAASKKDDLAIFRVDTKGNQLTPLALGRELGAGESIHLISHPDHRFYSYTRGFIVRKYIKPGTTSIRQCITADFAKGSSGAPVMDDYGNVIGMVAGTQNIYYKPDGEGYQMTIKEIIPVSRIKELLRQ